MKGFKHVFAAGALGLVLAVTGCTQYGTSVTEPPITTGNTRTTRSYTVPNRYAANTARNLNRTRNAAKTYTARTANRRTSRVVRTAPSGNEYSASALGGVNRSAGTVKRSRANTNSYRGTTGRTVDRDRNLAGGIYNTGNVTQLPAARRGGGTGSPFGDFNKDRAYSLTRNTAGVNNINAASDRVSRSTANANTTGGSVIRKSFSKGTEHTRSAEGGQPITAKTPASARRTGAGRTRTANKSNVTRTNNNSAVVNTANKGAANTINTAAKTSAANNVNTTANNANTTANNANTTANNVSRNTGTTVTNAKRAQGTGAVLSSLPAGRRSLNSGFEGVAYNERRTIGANKNRSTQRTHIKNTSAPTGKVTRTVYEVNDGTGRPARQAVSYDSVSESGNALMTNNVPARSRSRSTGTNRTSYVNDNLRGYGYFDNLTYGNTYRNADLRNNYNYTGTRYGYSPSGSYSGTTRGMDTGASGTYGTYGTYGRYGMNSYPGATASGTGYYGTAAGVYR